MKFARGFAALAFLFAIAPARADEAYPARPVTLIVPFAAGGASDVIARVVAEYMGQALGQRMVNENVPGAGGSLALTRVARATPDGYTIAIGNSGTNAAAYTLYPDIKYKPDDFAPIGLAAKTWGVLAVKKDFPAKSLTDLIAYAKANPGRVTLGHAGVGSSNYIICKSFVQAAGVDVTLVSYRGGAPALTDLIGGQVDGVCDNAASISPAIEGKQVLGLAVTSPQRLSTLPDVPTAAQAGLPDFSTQGWNALFAPKGTPAPVLAKLNGALRTALANETLRKRLTELGATVPGADETAPAHTEQLVRTDSEKLRQLLSAAK